MAQHVAALDAYKVALDYPLKKATKLGHGCYGVVYEVSVCGTPCIAKLIHHIFREDFISKQDQTTVVERFLHECDILSKLRHPKVVQFIGICNEPSPSSPHPAAVPGMDCAIILEKLFIDLENFIDKYPDSPVPINLHILMNVASGLMYLHSQEIVHRDLNAGNVLLTSDLRAKVADLGMSRVIKELPAGKLTPIPGSPDYMPPEAVDSRGIYGPSLDSFSFGHLSLYVANKQYPTPYDPSMDMVKKSKYSSIQVLKRKKWIDLLGSQHCLHDLVVSCLNDKPNKRPTMKEIHQQLKRLCEKRPRDQLMATSVLDRRVIKMEEELKQTQQLLSTVLSQQSTPFTTKSEKQPDPAATDSKLQVSTDADITDSDSPKKSVKSGSVPTLVFADDSITDSDSPKSSIRSSLSPSLNPDITDSPPTSVRSRLYSSLTPAVKSMKAIGLKKLVSGKLRRFTFDGFDLDLSYILPNIIVMGYPAENVEGIFRNNIQDVARFLDTRHSEHYKVYNLCLHRSYDQSHFHNSVAAYPFSHREPPPFEMIKEFCENVDAYLKADSDNVAVVHSKNGRGSTGVMICSYLLHNGHFDTAKDSLQFYAEARLRSGKGMTAPSLRRYVEYYNHVMRNSLTYSRKTVLIRCIRLDGIPNFRRGTCAPSFTIKHSQTRIYTSEVYDQIVRSNTFASLVLSQPFPVRGDVKIQFYHNSKIPGKEKIFHFWFNTFFVEMHESQQQAQVASEEENDDAKARNVEEDNPYHVIKFDQSELDKASEDKKHYPTGFQVRLFLDLSAKDDTDETASTEIVCDDDVCSLEGEPYSDTDPEDESESETD